MMYLVGVAGSRVMLNWSALTDRRSSLSDGAMTKSVTEVDFQM